MNKKRFIWVIALLSGIWFVFVSKSAQSEGVIDKIIDRLEQSSENARIEAAKADITAHIATALKLYQLDNEMFPNTEQGLSALLVKPTKEPLPTNWQGAILKTMPKDPWGNSYIYICPGIHNKESYDLSSSGPDGIESEDDINNWDFN